MLRGEGSQKSRRRKRRRAMDTGSTIQSAIAVSATLGPNAPPKSRKAALSNNADVRGLETDLSDKLGTNVTIKLDKKNNGTVTIAFMGFEHLDGILQRTKLK